MSQEDIISQQQDSLTEEQTNSLLERYGIPQSGASTEQVINLVQRLNQYENEVLPEWPQRMQVFHNQAESILKQQFSAQNIKLLQEAYKDALGVYTNPPGILNDALDLFHKHVTSIIKETGKSLLYKTVGEKLGAALSCPGEIFDGINNFWNELVKKHPILVPLDIIVVKPVIISLYVYMMPEIAIIKACELVGRSLIGIVKTGEWKKSIVGALQTITDSTLKHFGHLVFNNYQENMEDPGTIAATVAGAVLASKITGKDVQSCIKIMQDVLYSQKSEETKISIKNFCEDRTDDIAENLKKVFATKTGHLPKAGKSLQEIISAVQESGKINESEKTSVIQFIAAYAVKSKIEKTVSSDKALPVEKLSAEGKPKAKTHVETEKKRRAVSKLSSATKITNV